MALYENCSKEHIIKQYKETGSFSHDEIIRNDLSGIRFPKINLRHVKITQTYLDRALFSGMQCFHTTIEQSNCNELQAQTSHLDSSRIVASNFIKADFSHAHLHDVRFEQCVAHSIQFSHSRITSTDFYECQMYKAHFDGSMLINVTFHPGSKGDLSTLQKTRFTHSMIVQCSFSHMNLPGIDMSHSVFIGCDFTLAQLDDIDFSKTSFINCIFDDQVPVPGKLTNSPVGSTLFS